MLQSSKPATTPVTAPAPAPTALASIAWPRAGGHVASTATASEASSTNANANTVSRSRFNAFLLLDAISLPLLPLHHKPDSQLLLGMSIITCCLFFSFLGCFSHDCSRGSLKRVKGSSLL
jgi:hypothetical protein